MTQDRCFGAPARIGIDGRRLGRRPKGIGRYIWELCKGLDRVLPQALFYLYAPGPLDLPRISSRWSLREDRSAMGRLSSNLWLAFGVGRLARRDNVDCFWSGSGLLPLVGVSSPAVLTVHDLVHKVAPQTMDARALWGARLFFRRSVASADAVVTNSAATAARLENHFGCKAAAVVRPGLSQMFRPRPASEIEEVLAEHGVAKPYLLAVATWEPRKGLETLIQTFLNMKAAGLVRQHKLVLVGEHGWKDAAIRGLVRGNTRSVLGLGYVDDRALAALYCGADAFVFPSIYEGFGMPVLEARACGTVVVASDIPELREAGGNNGIYIEPTERGIRNGILTALQRHSAVSLDWTEWTWTQSATVLAQVLLSSSRNGSSCGERLQGRAAVEGAVS